MNPRKERTTAAEQIPVAVVIAHGDNGWLRKIAGIDIVAALPSLTDALDAPIREHAAVIVYADVESADAVFHSELAELARVVAIALVVPRITPEVTRLALTARVLGLLARDDIADVTRVVREIVHGRVAYPPDALAMLMDLVPRALPHRAASASSY
jgi:uncharacterized Rossmann fold enzyme